MKSINKVFMITSSLAVFSPIYLVVSCGEPENFKLKNGVIDNVKKIYKYENQPKEAFQDIEGINVLNQSVYNDFKMKFNSDNEIGITLIANNNIYFEIVKWEEKNKISSVLEKVKSFKIKMLDPSVGMGLWMQSFQIKMNNNEWSMQMHGKSRNKNYGDYYPIYLLNHKYAQLGITNQSGIPGDMIEISYDHNQ